MMDLVKHEETNITISKGESWPTLYVKSQEQKLLFDQFIKNLLETSPIWENVAPWNHFYPWQVCRVLSGPRYPGICGRNFRVEGSFGYAFRDRYRLADLIPEHGMAMMDAVCQARGNNTYHLFTLQTDLREIRKFMRTKI